MCPHALGAFLAAAFAAEVIGTMAGFGSATVLTPVASYFMPMKTAIAVVACFHLFGNASRIWFFGRQARWPIVAQFGLTAVLMSLAGAQAAAWISPSVIRVLLGGFLLIYVALEVTHVMAMRMPPTTPTLVAGGVMSGLVAGIIGTGGAIRSICLLAFGLPKEAYIGTSAVIALVVDAVRVPVYLREGFVPASLVPAFLGLVMVAFGGSWTGQRLVRRVSPAGFKRFVLVMLGVMGVKLLVDGMRGVG